MTQTSHLLRRISVRLVSVAAILAATAVYAEAPVDFQREIRPLLSNRCFQCHGPDAKHRKGGKGGLRLDQKDAMRADLGGRIAVVPGMPEASELIRRVSSTDEDTVMPPHDSGDPLTAKEVGLLRRWIREGAPFAGHWSYTPPDRPAIPATKAKSWIRSPVDSFILSRLEAEGLSPSRDADREAIIRRVTLDLTGLPPTIEEVDAFLSDERHGAYERLVDRILASDAFGEHWARMWLDLARYADSA
ncbi:MAG: DUF1549 domain-containing protein, partial [Planctomycetota bacterium]